MWSILFSKNPRENLSRLVADASGFAFALSLIALASANA